MKSEGAIISHVMTEIDIACLPKDLPEFIEVDLSELDTAHSLHVSGVKLPAGVTVVSRRTVDPVVATAVVPKAVVETEETRRRRRSGAAAGAARRRRKRSPQRRRRATTRVAARRKSGKDDKKK